MLYLETRWASLIPFARVVELLKDVLPLGDALNSETVRNHLQATGERLEQELGDERLPNLLEGSEEEWEQQPLPDGPITVGIDGGYVRAAHKQGWFEVIAGKSVVAFRREEEGEVPSAKCFGFVQTYDEKAAPAFMGAAEVARDARKSAGGVHVRWWRGCPPGAGVSTTA
jgi:hypothetical protein